MRMAIRASHRLYPRLLASGLALALIPGSASAQAWSPGPASGNYSKSEAILGAPSALDAILAQQKAPQLAAFPRLQLKAVSAPAYGAIFYVSPIAVPKPTVSAGVESGRPDLFGTVALRVNHTPLDAKWQAANRTGVGAEAARFVDRLKSESPFERLEAINWYVNRRVRFVDDSRQFGRPDVWSAASDTLRRRRGDCEDYAIAKLQMLRRAGLSGRDLYLVIVKDLVRRSDHAVLVARAAGHMYVLDNGTDEVLDSETISDYRPILSFSAAGEWTHGYRINPPPAEIAAAAGNPALVAASSPTLPQRSRSASLLAFNIGFNK
jgi:predicted transglutaminase-like cysteine proteinase